MRGPDRASRPIIRSIRAVTKLGCRSSRSLQLRSRHAIYANSCCSAAGSQASPGMLRAHRTIQTQTIKLIVPFVAGRAGRCRWPASSRSTSRPGSARTSSIENKLRRRHQHRRQGGRGGATRRLHAARRRPEHRLLPGAVSQARFRPRQGARAGRDPGHLVARDRGRAGGAGQDHSRSWSPTSRPIPGKLTFGFGLATMPHIIGEMFKQVSGDRHHRRALSRRRSRRAPICSAGASTSTSRRLPQLLPLIRTARSGRSPTPGRSAARICRTCRP